MPIVTVSVLLTTFKDSLLKLFSDVKTEVEFFIDNGLSEYIESIQAKFAYTKTFLYRNETVKFSDIFFPVSLKINNKGKKITTCEDLFKNSQFATIIGTAGSGKTMLMKHFFLTSIDNSYKIPIYIELRNLNDYDKSFTEFIYEVIFNNKLSPDQKILERLLATGQFILLLDGYDEIYSDRKNKITNDIDKFIDRYSKNHFLISSRPSSGIESLPRFNNYFVQELSNTEVFEFIDLVLKGNAEKDLATKIKDVISKSFDNEYSNFLRSPLLLSMFILTFNTYPELPKKKSKFYWNVFDTLANKHDTFTKKAGYQHERKTKLHNEDFEKILQWFAFKSLFQGKLNFDSHYFSTTLTQIKASLNYEFSVPDLIQDLTLAVSIIVIDGIEYRFPHKSLQEYFCASLIKDQSNDAKDKIYKSKLPSYVKGSTGGFDNFWNLCYELDLISFIKYFLIFHLERFKDQIKNEDKVKQLKNYFKVSGFGDAISFSNDMVGFPAGLQYITSFAVYVAIMKYLGMGDIMEQLSLNNAFQTPLFDLISDTKIATYKAYLINNVHYLSNGTDDSDIHYLVFHDHWNKNIESLLIQGKLEERLEEILQSIDLKIKELEEVVKSVEQVTDDLLNLD